jgi:hypothetical protein
MKMDNEPKDAVILLGSVNDPAVEERYRMVIQFGIGKRNFDMGYDGQLLMKCPNTKLKRLLATFPIVEGSKYWQTTHFWEESAQPAAKGAPA